ncbi:MAG: ABC transporter ATP-binding protein [Oscillospiraceae bacterium]|jgi:NitT/TauT family transport system ATP-binding protein|nr:ABC transporter ATP-binding protein [Oscillospiraceae bacterium]
MNSKKIVEFRNICMKYHSLKEETTALRNLCFSVFDKEFITIVGPSGCGKSTTLSLISGLIPPSSGEIFIEGSILTGINKYSAYMLQKDFLFDWRTIEENIFLGLEIKKKLNKTNKKYALKLLEKYGLKKFSKHRPYQLSGGMRQKVALIRTLTVNPKILLLDEPFSALDFQTKINISSEIKKIIKQEKKTAILVSHDISEAISLSDRVVVLSKRPSKVKKILKIEFDEKNLSSLEKRKHKKFNFYFDIIWNGLDKT